MAAPTKLPVWATDAGTTVEPTTGKKAAGWTVTEKPPARWFNWWMNLVYQWFAYVFNATDGNIQFTNSVANKRAIDVTGNGTAAGARFTGGSSAGPGIEAVAGAGGKAIVATGLVEASAGLKAKDTGNGSDTIAGYRIGTFTPALATDGTNNATHTTQQGEFVRIGDLVIATIYITGNTGSGSTGNVYISGLPYTVGNNGALGHAHARVDGMLQTNYSTHMHMESSDGSSGAFLYPAYAKTAAARSAAIGTAFVANQAFDIQATIVYRTDASF